MAMFQDIHLEDSNHRLQFRKYMEDGDYASAASVLQIAALKQKTLTAEYINKITGLIEQIEELDDPDFMAKLIICSLEPPADIKSGDVWFQKFVLYIWSQVNALNYTWQTMNNKALGWDEINRGGW